MSELKRTFHFPDLNYGINLMDIVPLILASWLGALILGFRHVLGNTALYLGGLLLFPMACCILYEIWNYFNNHVKIALWACSFTNAISGRTLCAQARKRPQDLVLYLSSYGGFDAGTRPPTLGILAEKNGGKFWVIYPFSSRAFEYCERAGMKINHCSPRLHSLSDNTLHKAIKRNDIAFVTRALEEGADVNDTDSTGTTLLMMAARSRRTDAEMVRLILMYGANVNDEQIMGHDTALSLAIGAGYIGKVELLLENGADIRYRDSEGCAAVMDAVRGEASKNRDVLLALLKLLVEQGAPLNIPRFSQRSPVSLLSEQGHFAALAFLLEAGAKADVLKWDGLMRAVALGTSGDVRQELSLAPRLTALDHAERTAWLLSLLTGDIAKIELLFQAGGSLQTRGQGGNTVLMYAIDNDSAEALSWLIERGADIEATNNFGATALMYAAAHCATECVRCLLQAGANVHYSPPGKRGIDEFRRAHFRVYGNFTRTVMECAANAEIARLLAEAGSELSEVPLDTRAALLELEGDHEIVCSREQYLTDKHPRDGGSNPEKMERPFWTAIVRAGATADEARLQFDDLGGAEDAVWCNRRYGQSLTALPDGRIVQIGGEHEEIYNPDFHIYNDVIVHHGGGRFDIYGYPQEVFAPTDFHSATLVGDFIYIIGCLGYPQDREPEKTPVYRLNCHSMAIERLETKGMLPGWISQHKAMHRVGESGQNEIHLAGGIAYRSRFNRESWKRNDSTYVLDLDTLSWRREGVL